MVLDPVHGRPPLTRLQIQGLGERLRDRSDTPVVAGAIGDQPSVRAPPQREERLPQQVRPGIARHADPIDLRPGDAAHRETGPNGLARKPGHVLDPAEALFFDGRHQFAVANEDRGHVTVVGVDPKYVHRCVGGESRYQAPGAGSVLTKRAVHQASACARRTFS